MRTHKHFQPMNFRSQTLNARPPSKAQQQALIEQATAEFYARGGVRQVLPDNYSARDVSLMGIREIHHLHHGKGPGGRHA